MATREPLVVSCGLGVDSVAMLVAMHRRGIRPDAILFADTGAEKPATYAYAFTLQAWLERVGFPSLQVVRYHSPRAGDASLEAECARKRVLPALAYGGHQCSIKWKARPQDRWLRSWAPALEVWAAGGQVVKAIGYDAGCRDQARSRRAAGHEQRGARLWFPLIEWGITREQCEALIREAGLPLPVKSACYFCPAMKRPEVEQLAATHPELLARALRLEAAAQARGLRSTKGLGRSWAWAEYLAGRGVAVSR